jgi:hypothetical protein
MSEECPRSAYLHTSDLGVFVIADLDTLLTKVILSFRVSQDCDLRRPVVDSVADETPAA